MESNPVTTGDLKSGIWDLAIPEFPAKIINGVRVPPFIDIEWVENMKIDVKPRPGDTWVVTFPKCGTMWTTQIVQLILNRGEDDGKNVMEAIPWIEAFHKDSPFYWYMNADELDKMPSPRAFKSHFSYEMMPCGLPRNTPGKYIYVCHNPKDVAVSFYHHGIIEVFHSILSWSGASILKCSCKEKYTLETILSTFLVGGPTRMTIMCSFSSMRT